MKNKTLPMVTMVTVAAMAALLASATIASYSNDLSATKKRVGDSNAQTSAANNDCPAELLSLIIGIQLQVSANCLNDANMVQDSDGTATVSTPFNAAPNQAIELEFGNDNGEPPDSTPPPG